MRDSESIEAYPEDGLDLIDRQAFLEKMKKTSRYFDVKFDIEEMPRVRLPRVRKTAFWRDFHYDDSMMTVSASCSNCGERALRSGTQMYPYCPNCGAEMKSFRDSSSNVSYWVRKEEMIRSPFAKNYYCEKCGHEVSELSSYCPNCESKMEGIIGKNEGRSKYEFYC